MEQVKRMESLPLESLIPYVNNARKHPEEQIKRLQASIREFGFVNPVLIDAKRNIIAGHGRVEAARREGITEVPCVFVEHLTPAQRKAYILADNKLAELAVWDMATVNVELESLMEMDFDVTLTGFDVPMAGEFEEDLEDARNDDDPVTVKVIFKNKEHFQKYEEPLRTLVESFEDVYIAVDWGKGKGGEP